MAYQLNPSNFQPGQVGTLYHLGIGNGVTGQTYGYMMRNQGPQSQGFEEDTNITDKDALIQYSSPNLIDRDLAFFPRVTQGDFSGGALQTVFLDATKYFDSDLEIRTPGYLTLRPAWQRTQFTTGLSSPVPQCVGFGGNVYTTFGENNRYYNAAGTVFAPGMTVKFLEANENALWISDGVNTIKFTNDNSTYVTSTSTSGTILQMWVVLQGTNGRFLYFTPDGRTLSKFDITNPIFSASVAVPLGNAFFNIVDLTAYQNGIALLTTDPGGDGSTDVWYHDGVNLTRIVRLEQYQASGITACLGNLYVTAQSIGQFEAPVLFQVSSGGYQVVARPSSPLATLTAASIGAPESSGQYVYFALTNPQLAGVTTTSYIGIYDSVTSAYSHLPNLDGLDAPLATGIRQLAFSGRAVAFPMMSGGNGYLQAQTNSSKLPAGNTYQQSGTMVSSTKDFGTPGIPKRFRRIEAVHDAPLVAGESVTIKGFVDQDPLNYTAALTPTASVTNSTVGSTLTALAFGADTVGRTEYDAIVLGGNGTSTPKVKRVAVEIGGTWTWHLMLDCTDTRRTLQQGAEDRQGVTGKDLYFLLRQAYENGALLTLYLYAGLSYTVTIESLKGVNPNYVDHVGTPVKADENWFVEVVLKQVQ